VLALFIIRARIECDSKGMRNQIFTGSQRPNHVDTSRQSAQNLGDEELARSIITGTFDIPADLDPATTLILKEIGKMGLKIMNGEGNEIIITPGEFTLFWKRVGEFTSSSSSGIHYGHYKAAIQDQMSTKVLTLQLTVCHRPWYIGGNISR